MNHIMSLFERPFHLIKQGHKTIEIRCNDEMRQELYNHFDFTEFGCGGDAMQRLLEGTRSIYSKEKEDKFGALGIRIKVMDAR